MKILLVEDEQKVALFIQKGLKENGYITEIAYDGKMGAEMATNNEYNAIILDINLPNMNGYDLCTLIRKSNKSIPIIMLTAFGTLDNKLNGFDVGANDYLVKPFEFRELLARLKNLVSRNEEKVNTGKKLIVANLEMDLNSKSVYRDNKKIDLTAKEYVLLEFFIRSKGRSVSRSEIAEKVWDINFDTGTNIVDVYVNFLRKKIDKDFSPKLIHTQFGMGYIFKEGDS
jgi:two-component system, OmpR family, copper resistance phosphate regulon response regulator CusR